MKKKKRNFEIAKNTHFQLSDLNSILTNNYKSVSNHIDILESKLDVLTFSENLMLDFIFKENYSIEDLISFSSDNIKDNFLKHETLEFLKELQQLELEEDIEDES